MQFFLVHTRSDRMCDVAHRLATNKQRPKPIEGFETLRSRGTGVPFVIASPSHAHAVVHEVLEFNMYVCLCKRIKKC
jgi:hypothetical protein